MSKEIYISSTPHETRLAIVENDALAEIYYERENEYTLAGSIYNGKVTRVLPGMQSSFVDIGLERDAFLYITDFMEEAGDAADFETHAHNGDHARAPRGENSRGGRGDRSDRGSRDGQRELPTRTQEPTDAELFTDAVSGLDPARPVAESERSGNRRGGRNRRDRNFNSDGTPRRDAAREEPGLDAASADAPIVQSGNRPAPASPDELGESAPGADGGRRWRGRRGRRGNRAPDREATNQPDSTNDQVSEQKRSASTGPISDSYPAQEDNFNASGAGFDVNASIPPVSSDAERNSRGGRDGGRRERGAERPPRVPRGFAPTLHRYQVDEHGEDTNQSPAYGTDSEETISAEPLILPGESLSKYRAGGESDRKQADATPSPAPSTEFQLAEAWDGGFVLPGETLRRRDSGVQSSAPAREDSSRRESYGREGRESGRNDRNGRNERGDRTGRNERGDRNDRGQRNDRGPRSGPQDDSGTYARADQAGSVRPPVSSASHSSDPSLPAQPDMVAAPGISSFPQERPIHSTFVAPPPMPSEHEPRATSPQEKATSSISENSTAAVEPPYEPSEASASYRVDPAPPSEFRQAATVPEEAVSAPTHSAGHLAEPSPRDEAALQSQPHDASTPTEVHEHTSIDATGEMHSEPPASSVLATHDLELQNALEPIASPADGPEVADSISTAQTFAPGNGVLEEEVMEEEDGTAEKETLPLLLAQHAPESEGQEDTFEGATDLGTMLRELSIDQITRSEAPLSDEDDDFEEDFVEEDQDFDSDQEEEENESDDEEEDHAADGVGFEDNRRPTQQPSSPDQADHIGHSDHSDHPASGASDASREPRRDGRRDERGRRDGRRGERNRRPGLGERSASSDRERGSERNGMRRDGRNGRQSMQSTNLPAISDLLKPGQEILCQIAKEPIAKKGARITSHIALPGRFLVFMPTVNHTGVSRKIESDSERRRLKEILLSEKGEASGGFIVRTAASGASEDELRSDLRFLLNLWADIKQRSEASKSPALIYHDLNLVERVLRDQVTDTFSAIWVDTESEYERVLRFLQRFQPSLIRRVKLYIKETPLFEQFGITEEINKALRSKVWLKSGGSIVINQTEALVAIDINTGKFVGKTARLEDTIVKTNLDAIPEIVRQIRLRDLGGIIIIDFIDMDERKNRNKVMAALEEELKSDRAPSKVLQFNDFGLVAITRKRVKQSLERTLSTTCGVCQGTGMVKSPVSVCNDIYIEMRKMHKHLDRGDVMLRVNPEVVKQLKSTTSKWLQEMEELVGKTILVKSDPSLHPEQFDIH